MEKRILNALYRARRALNTSEVADGAGVSWNTAKKYLKRLNSYGYVRRKTKGKSIYWWIRTK